MQGTDKLTIDVFPNPSEGMVYVSLNTSDDTEVTIEVFDMMDNLIYPELIKALNDTTAKIDFGNHPAGQYIVKVSTPNSVSLQTVTLTN